jgi:hypothetical protein
MECKRRLPHAHGLAKLSLFMMFPYHEVSDAEDDDIEGELR